MEKHLLEKVLVMLLQQNDEIKKLVGDVKPTIPYHRYLEDFCTIRIKMARGAGHTTCIKNKAHPQRDFVVTPFTQEFIGSGLRVSYPREFMQNAAKGILFENLYVDNATYVFDSLLESEEFYQYIARSHVINIILLG